MTSYVLSGAPSKKSRARNYGKMVGFVEDQFEWYKQLRIVKNTKKT